MISSANVLSRSNNNKDLYLSILENWNTDSSLAFTEVLYALFQVFILYAKFIISCLSEKQYLSLKMFGWWLMKSIIYFKAMDTHRLICAHACFSHRDE